ncbi:fibrous sheath CABYR-binding protein-like [Eptesicus fuscus]|uniref:fibrous sheath CABYR-binding protein-like n=1 Tax=Eptesicus fuscus TaxID=29078 RepID=UPI002403B9D8|nr:fibrous sheath CABYR-binding protein-like [Eptesicus fuscus]
MEQNLEQYLEPWNPGNQAAPFYNCPFPSHSDRGTVEDTMFSCCLPVCRGRGLKRGSDESICQRARRWVRTQSRRRVWPFSRRNPKSSTYVKKEQQLLEESPCDMGSSEGPVSHTTEGQDRPEVRVATWASGEPEPVDGQPGTPPPKLPTLFWPPTPKPTRFYRPPTPKHPRFHRQRKVFTRDLDYGAHVNQTGQEHLKPKEAEPKARAQEAKATPPDAELEASSPPEFLPPPAASRAAAVEPGPAPDKPSLEPMLAPASEEELPVEGPAQGPLVECAQAVRRDNLVFFLFFSFFVLFFCSPCFGSIFYLLMFIVWWRFWRIVAFIILFFLFLPFISPIV